jgi:hypothetical protein
MKHPPASWITALMGVVVVAALPLLGHWARSHASPGCARDGVRVRPEFRVEVVDDEGHDHVFCSLRCAKLWLRDKPSPRAVVVTDEITGDRVDATKAFYVRSTVVTPTTTDDRVHVFRNQADAERHAQAYNGFLLTGAERPFR